MTYHKKVTNSTDGPNLAAGQRTRLLFLVTEDWSFCQHRLPLARAARDAGYEVVVIARVGTHGAQIRAEGFRLYPLNWHRGSLNLLEAWRAIYQIILIHRQEKPDLVHHFAMKPILIGSLAAWFAGTKRVINAPTGLGHLFLGTRLKTRLLRLVLFPLFRLLLNRPGSRLLVQNNDDIETLSQAGLINGVLTALIPGSGVDINDFKPQTRPIDWERTRPVNIGQICRMIREKGVGEFAEAARLLRERGVPVNIQLIGPCDPENPQSFTPEDLQKWQEEGLLTWHGPMQNISSVLADLDICVLASYREGFPKTLLEAAACGVAMVAADVPGCREICLHEKTGLLCPPQDPVKLADALQRLVGDPGLRARLGAAGRQLIVSHFAADIITEQSLALYRTSLCEEL